MSYDIHNVLVPVANPATAGELLKLGLALAHPEDGQVIALVVVQGNLDAEANMLKNIEPLIEQLQEQGHNISLRTSKAGNVARGILDAASENGVDLLVLGLRQHKRGEVVLGTIAENVLAAAHCDIVIYRPGKAQEFKRVVVPADGSVAARSAAEMGGHLAQHYAVPLEAMYVQPGYIPRWQGLGRIAASLEDVDASADIRRTLVTAQYPAEGILARLEEDDLLIVGYSERSGFERWLFGDFSRWMLNHAPGSVIVTGRSENAVPVFGKVRRELNRFVLRLTPAEQDDITREAFELSSTNLDYLVLIGIAATLASLGLLVNSGAVIIGAMLVAPFMQPCIAFAVGLTTGQLALMRRALLALAFGIPLALLVAGICGVLLPNQPPTPEMLGRTHPTLLDALVAAASGVMGAYATARKDIPSALAGVAIAAALMPPLCTFGLLIAAGNWELGLRAGLLFLANIVCISMAAWAVFWLVGLSIKESDEDNRAPYRWLAAFSFLMLPTVILLLNLSVFTNKTQAIQQALATIFEDNEVVQVEVQDSQPIVVRATIRTHETISPLDVSDAQEKLADVLDQEVTLEVIEQHIITSGE